MTNNELMGIVQMNSTERMRLLESKGSDYASDENALKAFNIAAGFAGVTTAQALDVMIGIKLARIESLRGKEAKHESVLDTYKDLQNYLDIRLAFFMEQETDLISRNRPEKVRV